MHKPFDLGEHQVVIGTTIGIALAPQDGDGADVLLKNADLALYRAKAVGRGSFSFFAAEMDRHLNDLRSSARLPGVDAIRLPGEDRQKRRADRTRNGVALPPTLVKQLDELAANGP